MPGGSRPRAGFRVALMSRGPIGCERWPGETRPLGSGLSPLEDRRKGIGGLGDAAAGRGCSGGAGAGAVVAADGPHRQARNIGVGSGEGREQTRVREGKHLRRHVVHSDHRNNADGRRQTGCLHLQRCVRGRRPRVPPHLPAIVARRAIVPRPHVYAVRVKTVALGARESANDIAVDPARQHRQRIGDCKAWIGLPQRDKRQIAALDRGLVEDFVALDIEIERLRLVSIDDGLVDGGEGRRIGTVQRRLVAIGAAEGNDHVTAHRAQRLHEREGRAAVRQHVIGNRANTLPGGGTAARADDKGQSEYLDLRVALDRQ